MLPLKFVVLASDSELNLVEYLTLMPGVQCNVPTCSTTPTTTRRGRGRGRRWRRPRCSTCWGSTGGAPTWSARAWRRLVAVLGTLANLIFLHFEVPQPQCNKSRNIFLNFRKQEAVWILFFYLSCRGNCCWLYQCSLCRMHIYCK